jgi:hypothetical protein
MTSKQRRRLSMYLAVKQFLAENEIITKDIPHYADSFKSFIEVIGDIEAASEKQLENRKGIAEKKKELQDNLVALTCDYSRKLKYYAQITSDVELEEEVKFSKSDIKDMRDNSLLVYCESVCSRAESIDADLSEYLINAETGKVFRKALDQFSEYIDKPRLGIVDRAVATTKLELLFSKGNTKLRDIDILLRIIAASKPSFFSQYLCVRRVLRSNTGPLSLRVRVTEALTGIPVHRASISCTLTEEERDTIIRRRSARKGGIALKNLRPGEYRVAVSRIGYISKVAIVPIDSRERKDLVVELEKLF